MISLIFHCDADQAVNISYHSDKFAVEMKRLGHDITYDIVNGRGHCDLTAEMWERYAEYITEAVGL